MQNVSRLKFIKQSSITFGAIGTSIYFNPFQVFTGSDKDLSWDKAPCRFCGTGCSVMVGVKDGVIMAVKDDSESSVNQGALCIEGYALPFEEEERLKKLPTDNFSIGSLSTRAGWVICFASELYN